MPMVVRLRPEPTASRPGDRGPFLVAAVVLLVLLAPTVIVVGAILSIVGGPEGMLADTPASPALTPPEVTALVNAIERKYQLVLEPTKGTMLRPGDESEVVGRGPSHDELSAAVPLLEEELATYPPTALRAIGLRRLYLFTGLTSNGDRVAGTLSPEQGEVYLNVGMARWPAAFRQLVHHELYHAIDDVDDGVMAPDPAWDALNARGFGYGRRGDQLGLSTSVASRLPGFVSEYATANSAEDKAEVYCTLMVYPGPVDEWCREDPVLKRKVEHMRFQLGRWQAGFDAAYWKWLAAHREANPVPLPRW